MRDTVSIGELAAASGVAVSAIRYYERIGLLLPAGRVNGQRRYTSDALTSLSLIRLGQTVGFTLAELRALRQLDGAGPGDKQWEALLSRKLNANATSLQRLERAQALLNAALECGCSDLATCANRAALDSGAVRPQVNRGGRTP